MRFLLLTTKGKRANLAKTYFLLEDYMEFLFLLTLLVACQHKTADKESKPLPSSTNSVASRVSTEQGLLDSCLEYGAEVSDNDKKQ